MSWPLDYGTIFCEYILPNSATPREGVFSVANSPEGERKEVIKKKNISRLRYALPVELLFQVKKIGVEPMTLQDCCQSLSLFSINIITYFFKIVKFFFGRDNRSWTCKYLILSQVPMPIRLHQHINAVGRRPHICWLLELLLFQLGLYRKPLGVRAFLSAGKSARQHLKDSRYFWVFHLMVRSHTLYFNTKD